MSDVAAAQARAEAARQRLTSTVEALQTQLAPERIARRAVSEVSESGSRAARASVAVARRNPVAVAGAAAVLLAALNRKRIAALFARPAKRKPLLSIKRSSVHGR
ncbi:DUF3618 domain-containing protein [uncultured Sphingomonas sp.]|jgi:hypothetical protein|uniref:DUF3618 domain-containing protein n=1 Tax=uncultured Sphingomonas sp. TaxID=158754 RepID=UPI0030D73E05